VPEREPEADRQRSPAAPEPGGPVGQELAGRVVHRGDVVGVERVPEPERVREDADAGPEDRGRTAELITLGDDQTEQHAHADDVQGEDEGPHADQ
jgi:hypothetical protein